MNGAVTALRFFFHMTLGRTGFGDSMATISSPERLPVVLNPEEVSLVLAHAPSLKDRAGLTRLVGAILLEQNDEWSVQRARYMPLDR